MKLMKLSRLQTYNVINYLIISLLCHVQLSYSLITPEEAHRRNFEYENLSKFRHKIGKAVGRDQIELSKDKHDLKLAFLDPKLYKILKDPVKKKFKFTLDDAVTSIPKRRPKKFVKLKGQIFSNDIFSNEIVSDAVTVKPRTPKWVIEAPAVLQKTKSTKEKSSNERLKTQKDSPWTLKSIFMT